MTEPATPGSPAFPPDRPILSGPPEMAEPQDSALPGAARVTSLPDAPRMPAVPAGPGVAVPFAAPPVQRDMKKLWIGLGAGAIALVLCCVGGLVGFGVMIAGSVQESRFEAKRLVQEYLTALKDKEYQGAYRLLCGDLTRRESSKSFASRMRADPVVSFAIRKDAVNDPRSSYYWLVRATVAYAERGELERVYRVRSVTEGMSICGES